MGDDRQDPLERAAIHQNSRMQSAEAIRTSNRTAHNEAARRPSMDIRLDAPQLDPLTDAEIEQLFEDIDTNRDGVITFDELEAKLEEVHQELAPNPKEHHLHHPERRFQGTERDIEKAIGDPEHDGLVEFLHSLMPDSQDSIDKTEFHRVVKSWNIPSQKQTSSEEEDANDDAYEQKLSLRRRIRAHWSVEGPKILFITFVVCFILGMSLWQGIIYIRNPAARAALGWGVILAKFSAGALYPTLFFMLLSMSRHFATAMRHSYHLSKFINWDRSQSFHIWMSCAALVFATLHAIGHLTGTFLYGSRPAQQDKLAALLGPDQVPKPYVAFVRTRPGWTGIVSLGLFYIIAVLSHPKVRAWSYELFQAGHLLMFPMIGLLCAHGTAQILQYPMLGYWLAFPALLVIAERVGRFMRGLSTVQARMEILDEDTVSFTCRQPEGDPWRFHAGQYVFLQVPCVSFFQWHPFTVSACFGDQLQVHIKTDGDWTKKLRELPTDRDIRVGVDGPFGAPAQRFYDFDRSLIIGAGVGITPFSAVLTDLEQHLTVSKDPWKKSARSTRRVVDTYSVAETRALEDLCLDASSPDGSVHPNRRVDFHWMVRDRNYLLWFSSLLNRAYDLSYVLPPGTLDLNIQTHITARRNAISTHVFRYLLDAYRTESAPVSALTGLKPRSHFGRPDLEQILRTFHEDMIDQKWIGGKVGVFFCGSPKIGRVLADTCSELTAKARADGSKIRYVFMMEVFG